MVFPVVMYGCECGTIKKAEHWRIDVFELWCNPKGNQFWIFIRRTDAEAEVPILWPLDEKSWLIRKVPDTGKDWRQKEKGMTDDEMVGWHHWLNGHEFEQAPDGEGQRSLACCSPWGHTEFDRTEQLNWTELTPVLLPRKSHGQRSLVGYSPWGHKRAG